MKSYLLVLIILLIFGCNRQQKADEALKEIVSIVKQDSVLRYDEYKRATTLYEKHKNGILSRMDNDSTLLFKFIADVIGNCYNDMYHYYDDTIAAQKYRDLHIWSNKLFTSNSQYSSIVASKLFEAYCFTKNWKEAESLLEKNFSRTTIPSIDHAILLYSKAWMYGEMGNIEDAISTMQEAKLEYEELLSFTNSAIQNKNCTEDLLTSYQRGKELCCEGIKDCEKRLFEWGVFLSCDGSIKKKNKNDNYVYAYLHNLDSLLIVERTKRAPYENRETLNKDGLLDSARLAWTHFVKLCKSEQYDEAFSYYENTFMDSDFMIYLTYSEFWYRFAKDIYLEYYRVKMTYDNFLYKVIDVFKGQQYLANLIIKAGKYQGNTYYPLHYDELQSYLFIAYTEAELWDEAQNQQNHMETYTIERYGKDHYSYATILFNQACLYHETGRLSQAIKTMKDSIILYKAYIDKYPDDPNLSDIQEFRANAEEKLNEWLSN